MDKQMWVKGLGQFLWADRVLREIEGGKKVKLPCCLDRNVVAWLEELRALALLVMDKEDWEKKSKGGRKRSTKRT